jgi:DNA replication licensing factor MCM3
MRFALFKDVPKPERRKRRKLNRGVVGDAAESESDSDSDTEPAIPERMAGGPAAAPTEAPRKLTPIATKAPIETQESHVMDETPNGLGGIAPER